MLNVRSKSRYHSFTRLIVLLIVFAVFLVRTATVSAQVNDESPGKIFDEQPTVVLVSMADKGDNVYWSDGEARITDELHLSDLDVISVESGTFAGSSQQDALRELKNAAESQNATSAILIYRTGSENVHLSLYAKEPADNSETYKEYDIPLSSTGDETDIAAFKAAELIHAMIDVPQ